MEDLIKKLEEKEQKSSAKSIIYWKPMQGEVLQGVVEEAGSTITVYGEQEYLQLRTESGQRFLVWVNSVLKHQILSENIEVGDTIAVKYLGIKTSAKNRKKTYKDYVLVKASEG